MSSTDSSATNNLDGFPLESLDAFDWNHWMTSIGIGGWLAPEYAHTSVYAYHQGASMTSWIDQELAGCQFADVRLDKRFRNLMERLAEGVGETISMACQDWANTKAAYRFFSNPRVGEEDILAGHFQSTRDRFRGTDGVVLVLHDTTEFSFRREQPELIGNVKKLARRRNCMGQPQFYTTCGILMHSSLVVTPEGLPLGISAIKFWTRKEFKGTNALKKKINPTRVPI
jgi:hypothetical protein